MAKDKKPKPGISIDFGKPFDLSNILNISKEEMDDLRRQVSEMSTKQAAQMKHEAEGKRMAGQGGEIHVEGGVAESLFGSSLFGGMRASEMAAKIMGQYAVPTGHDLEGETFKNAVARLLWNEAIKVWEEPLGWQFMVGYNPGLCSFWFTAKFWDDEADTFLVEGTVEVTEEAMARRNWGDSELDIERQMEALQEKLLADLAAFEED